MGKQTDTKPTFQYGAFLNRLLQTTVKQKSCITMAVAVKLLNLGTQRGYSYCSAAKIGEMLGVEERSVQRATKWLVKEQLFCVVETKGRLNCYAPVLLPDEQQQSPEEVMSERIRHRHPRREDKAPIIYDQATGRIYTDVDAGYSEDDSW